MRKKLLQKVDKPKHLYQVWIWQKKTLNLIAATDDYTHLHPFDHPLSAGLPPSIIDGKKSVNNNNNVSEAGNGATGNGKIDHRAARGPVQNIPEYHPPYLSQLRKCDRKPETLSNKVVTHVEFWKSKEK